MLEPFIVAEIVRVEPHPNCDYEVLCDVDTGDGILKIITNIGRARRGLKTVLARPGDIIPATRKAVKAKMIRGIQSQGMLCSGYELGLSDEADHIIELPETAQAGQKLVDIIAMIQFQ